MNDLYTINNIIYIIIMYADDTNIHFNIYGLPSANLANHITTELDKIDAWLKHNKLPLNVEKNTCLFTPVIKTLDGYSSQKMENYVLLL